MIKQNWRQFDTPLIRKPGVEIPEENNYGMQLVELKQVKSPKVKALVDEHQRECDGKG